MNSNNNQEDKIRIAGFGWINQPQQFSLENDRLTIITDPKTDFWQRTHYGFRNDNGHAFIQEMDRDFTFAVKTDFKAVNQYDQCGIILYLDPDNWVKASVESENQEYSRLGSVVTNLGYSDWASTDISPSVDSMWYRFSRRGPDFLIEHSSDGKDYRQMRIFHIHNTITIARVGVYACSPVKAGFKAVFSNFKMGECIWTAEH